MIKDNWCAPSVSKLARDLEEAVKDLWDNRDEGGCCHWPIYYEEDGKEWDVVLGWSKYQDIDDDMVEDVYVDGEWCICASVRYQTAHNAMQTDMDIDFLMPYPVNEYGDVWDDTVVVSREENYNTLAKDLLEDGKKMVELFADKDDEEDEEEDEDMDESRQRRGHILRESHRPRGRMLRESEDTSRATVTAMWTGKVIAYENVLKLIGKYEGEDLYRKVKTLADDARSELESI